MHSKTSITPIITMGVFLVIVLFTFSTFSVTPILGEPQEARGLKTVKKDSDHCRRMAGASSRALLIGNNDYLYMPKLRTAMHDVDELKKVLCDMYGFTPDHIRLIKDANRYDLLAGFDYLKRTSGPNDNVLIFYGGHGYRDDTGRGFWIPIDGKRENTFDYVSNEEILGLLGAISAKHKLIISDSCFSGKLLVDQRSTIQDYSTNRYFIEKSKLRSVQGLTSGGNEPVSDGGPQWEGHSIFAFHLLAQLRANQKEFLSANLLGNRLAEIVANDSGHTPIIRPIRGQRDQGGEFFFIKKFKLDDKLIFACEKQARQSDSLDSAGRLLHKKFVEAAEKLNIAACPKYITVKKMATSEHYHRQLRDLMYAEKASVVIVCTIKDRFKKETGLLWEGKVDMRVTLQAYAMRAGEVKRIAFLRIKEQTLPFRKWVDNEKVRKKHYQKAALKVTHKWSEKRLYQFLKSAIKTGKG